MTAWDQKARRSSQLRGPMPKGPKGEPQPANVIGNAIRVAKIATGEAEVYEGPPEKSAAAIELGRRGGRKRAEVMAAERRAEIARKAAQKRWKSVQTDGGGNG
jgi:hypothetical protein